MTKNADIGAREESIEENPQNTRAAIATTSKRTIACLSGEMGSALQFLAAAINSYLIRLAVLFSRPLDQVYDPEHSKDEQWERGQ